MSSVSEASSGGGKAWIGYTVAAACLVWVFHDVRWGDLFAHVKTMTWWLLVPATAADIGSYLTQGARWSLLLHPLGRLSILKATQAIYAALFINEVLPLRAGEVLRGYLASRWTSLSMMRIISSILVERFLDGVWMVLALGVVVLAVPLPRYLVDAEEILALVIFAAAALFVYLVLRKERQTEVDGAGSEAATPPGRPAGYRVWSNTWRSHCVRSAALRPFMQQPRYRVFLLVLQVLSFWFVMEAYGMSLSVWHGAAVFLILHLGTMVPGAPSNVGTYQFFTVLGLMVFGVDKTVARRFFHGSVPDIDRSTVDHRAVRVRQGGASPSNGARRSRQPEETVAKPVLGRERGAGGSDDSVGD